MRFKGWLFIFMVLIVVNLALTVFGRQWRFDSIVVHHSAGSSGDYASIRAQHEKRGWSDAAYHLLLSNGSTDVPLGTLEPTSHFKSLSYAGATKSHLVNVRSLQLCVVGNYEANEMPQELRPALAHALRALCEEFSIPTSRIIFHRDVNNTACPGKHLTKDAVMGWIETLADACPKDLQAQHDQAIAISSLSLSSYPRGLLVLQACVSLILFVIFFGMVRLFGRAPTRRNRSSRSNRTYSAATRTRRPKTRRNRHV